MNTSIFYNKNVLITAGPTREAIDPVRYISNHSSGKMGYAIAGKFLQEGARVWLVSGPVPITLEHPCLTVIRVNSAEEMYKECRHYFHQSDIVVFAAAVADYRPAAAAMQKIRKTGSSFTLSMVRNVDIALELGKLKTGNQVSVGFALETNNELAHAQEKLTRKNFDMIVLNSMNDANATFGYDTNKVTIVKKEEIRKYSLKQKAEVAVDIVREIESLLVTRERSMPVIAE